MSFSDAPERHPECSWEIVNEPLDVLFICSWYGGYPVPTLDWHEVLEEHVIAKGPTVNSTSQETERLEVHVNGFILKNGEEVKCIGHHVTGVEKSCSFKLSKTIFSIGLQFLLFFFDYMQNVTQTCFNEIYLLCCFIFLSVLIFFFWKNKLIIFFPARKH